MKIRILSGLLVCLILASLLMVGIGSPSTGCPPGEYCTWCDFDDDGDIDIFDIVDIAGRYGTTGTPINTTALLLELQARIDELEVVVASHNECIVVTGIIPYDGNGAYDPVNGLSQDVSSLIPTEFTLIAAIATGYKANQMTGVRQNEPPLILEPKVSGTTFQTRVWDASGDEYGGANWSSMRAHIDYTLFITK